MALQKSGAPVFPIEQIFVGGLTPNLTESVLRQHFQLFGAVRFVEIKKDRVILKDDTKDFELLLPSY